ncbi:hypothetical protein PAEPH01_2093 [Pancytospora epiphaga]|nr:hypothetical protein PAEPH01_2093 [Pancytospora epiphaga]
MLAIKNWGIQITVALTYATLCFLYFFEDYTKLNRFPTIISLQSSNTQFVCVMENGGLFALYSPRGHQEKVNKWQLNNKDGWLLRLLSRELSEGESAEIRINESMHICECRIVSNARTFVFPYNSAIELKMPNYTKSWNSLIELSKFLNDNPASIDENEVESLKRMLCVYAGFPVPLHLIITNDCIIAQTRKEAKVFKIDVEKYLKERGIEGYEEREVILHVNVFKYEILVSSAREYARGQYHNYLFPAKDESLLKKMSEAEHLSKGEDLQRMEYQKYVSDDEFTSFSKSLEEYFKSSRFNSFLNDLHESSKTKRYLTYGSDKNE